MFKGKMLWYPLCGVKGSLPGQVTQQEGASWIQKEGLSVVGER